MNINYKKIIIPSSLHPDTILAIFLLKKFGESKYLGISNAEVEICQELPEGETPLSLKQKGVLVLDLGGGEFDHHNKEKILSELVAEDLGIIEDGAITRLLAYIKRDDQYGMGTISTDQLDRTFGLSGLISSLNKSLKEPKKVMAVIFPVLEAHYLEEKKRTTELPLEFEQKLQEGRVEMFDVKHKGKKVKVIILESDNISMPGWLKSSIGPKADVVCQRMSAGFTNILTKQSKRIDLRWMAAYIRNEELQLKDINIEYPVSQLMKPSRMTEVPEWYYDRATNSLLNGSVNPKGISPTAISLKRIKEIIKESLERDIAGYR